MWLYDNWARGRYSSKSWLPMVCFSVFVIVIGSFLTVAGTYGTVLGVIEASGESSPFTCADNSNST
jgi:hypothetical protein